MSDLPVPVAEARPPQPAIVAPPADAPTFGELFTFMRDAELRFSSLRMRIVDRVASSRGDVTEALEVWLRHPGQAKVLTRTVGDQPRGDSRIWVSDGSLVRTYDMRADAATTRPVRARPEGLTSLDLPPFSRVYQPRTPLPMETLADTFVHPHGYCRNVLQTGDLTLLGTTRLRDRETWLIRCDHPRRAEILEDRPDRSVEVGVDRLTGLMVLLVESIGGSVTRQAEVTDLEIDAPIGDDAFALYVSDEARRLY
ncbi:MAG: hypothetical protein ACRDF7_04265 [Candidatus Limnocylindrales bacterium]